MTNPIMRLLRPRTFLYFVSLETATEFIAFTFLINKVSGLYGVLALLTGFHLSPVQLSMYMYSILAFALGCYLTPHIRGRSSPLHCLGIAWLYVLDSLINACYTLFFAAGWFLLLARHLDDNKSGAKDDDVLLPPGGKTINDTAGFTSPEQNATRVDVIAEPAGGLPPGQDAVAVPVNDGSSTLGNAVFHSGSVASLSVVVAVWSVRVYCCLIVMSHARSVLRRHVVATSAAGFGLDGGPNHDPRMAPNPFREDRPDGQGWPGALGRLMTRFGTSYWLGADAREEADAEWARGAGRRFKAVAGDSAPEPGVRERERRARSGTGPPPANFKKAEAS